MKNSGLVRRGAGFLCFCLLPLSAMAVSTAFPAPTPSGAAPSEEKPPTLTMEQWRAAKEAAEAAVEAPRGDERIARCRAFLDEHPDYPELAGVRRALIDAYVDKGEFDPAQLAALLERLSEEESLVYWGRPEILVEQYYFKHKLPLESAQRLLRKARADIAAEKQAIARETDAKRRETRLAALEIRLFHIELGEGRVLLARGDYSGAIELLLQAEATGLRTGAYGVSLQGSGGGRMRGLPLATPRSNWLNLSLATAYWRTGDRKKAGARLAQVQNFNADFFPEIETSRKSLARELGVPPEVPQEVRADPRPAADFRLKDLNGKEVSLSDFKDRVVLAMFWATW